MKRRLALALGAALLCGPVAAEAHSGYYGGGHGYYGYHGGWHGHGGGCWGCWFGGAMALGALGAVLAAPYYVPYYAPPPAYYPPPPNYYTPPYSYYQR